MRCYHNKYNAASHDWWLSKSVSRMSLRNRRKISALSQFCTVCQTSAHCFWDINHLHLKAEKAFFFFLNFWAKSGILTQTEVLWKSVGVLYEQRLHSEAYSHADLEGNYAECCVTPRGVFGPQESRWAMCYASLPFQAM